MTIAKTMAAAGLTGLLMVGSSAVLADESLPAEQVISAIQAAVAAHPGEVQEVDIDKKDDLLLVKVEIKGSDGKEHDVRVNPATGEVKKKEGLL